MTAFDNALAALHSDPNLSRSATYFAGGAGPGVVISVIWAAPESKVDFGESGAIVREVKVDVMLADICDPKRGDRVESINTYSVEEVLKDAEQLSARLILKAVRPK